MSENEIIEREQKAQELYRSGFNCCQAVFCACADIYNIDNDLALRISAAYGGGVGQMRMLCGAANGMFLLAGLEKGNTLPNHPELKKPTYQLVQQLAAQYKDEYGSLICSELLGLTPTSRCVRKEPCIKMIAKAVRIACENIDTLINKQ
mgnify:FL=1